MENSDLKYESEWTVDGFMTRFDELIKQHRTYTEAYIQAEKEHTELFGKLRYSSYESFRHTRRDWVFKRTA